MESEVLDWLLDSDPSVRFQTKRDLLDLPSEEWEKDRNQMLTEGWIRRLLDLQDAKGTWGNGLYGPKFISTHYTLQLLRRLEAPSHPKIAKGCSQLIKIQSIGGLGDPVTDMTRVDACITGMGLAILAFYGEEVHLFSDIFDYLQANQLDDGGWNCRFGRKPEENVTHSSMHTTMSVLEGLRELGRHDQSYETQIDKMISKAHEFLLNHELYKSHRTGELIHKDFVTLAFPPRWKYNILTAMDYFRSIDLDYDERMGDAIQLIRDRGKDGYWYKGRQMSGKRFFSLTKPRKYSEFNTLRAQRVLKTYDKR